ncbi:lipase family alpha/beta hydrolase [Ideonella margarita]|uniref:Alpha/beta hydrolase n=1 Tax=Ideonella margarita TaxID=2984191 RepID=A0ABU9C8K5_9BURK
MKKPGKRPVTTALSALSDLRGSVRLAVEGTQGVTGMVESVHQRVVSLAPPLGKVADTRTTGLTGFVYRSIRNTTHWVGTGLDAALALAQRTLAALPDDDTAVAATDGAAPPQRRLAVLAALNGVLGDHLAATDNPLALTMGLHRRPADVPATPHVLVLVHGLCMNDLQWTHQGHDHGQMLAAAGWSPVYARYNSGLHISANGLALAQHLERCLAAWPVPVASVALLGHSMGGLVLRSALQQAQAAGMAWPAQVRQLVCLGTPHHGAPLEQAGSWVHQALSLSPYLMPFTRLAGLRSAGITDLRYGNLLASDIRHAQRHVGRDQRTPVSLPAGVASYAVAGSLAPAWLGDGLVTIDSALGRHRQSSRALGFPASRTFVAKGCGHMNLLDNEAVQRHLQKWLTL